LRLGIRRFVDESDRSIGLGRVDPPHDTALDGSGAFMMMRDETDRGAGLDRGNDTAARCLLWRVDRR
jgi:hypothetical protein